MSQARARRTRGNTQRGRLARLDAWLTATGGDLLTRQDGPWAGAAVVDVGIGAYPHTTAELADAVQSLDPTVPVIGVDIAPRRVAYAQRTAGRPGLSFREGGFDLPLKPGESVRVVRAMNLLRQYRPAHVADAHARLARPLLPGGLLVEGSSDGPGHILAAHLLRRTGDGLVREGLWLSTDGHLGFAPAIFLGRLPRDLRRTCLPGTALHAFFEAWTAAWSEVRSAHRDHPFGALCASIAGLAEVRDDVDGTRASQGDLVWRPAGGIPVAPSDPTA